MRSNCIAQACREYVTRLRAGEEAYIVIRASRSSPHWVPHVGVGRMAACGHIEVSSFKPISPTDVPWWLVWRRLQFDGEWTQGDAPTAGQATAADLPEVKD